MDAMQLLGVGAVFVLAGAVKGVTGMGLPTVAVSLLGLWLAPIEVAALLVVPTLATNLAQCRGPHWRLLLRRLWPAWLALCVVVVAWPDPALPPAWPAHRLLGAVLLVYGGVGLWRPVLPDLSRPGRGAAFTAAGVGAATGLVTAATAVFVLPMVPWLQALRLPRAAMVQALGLSFTVATLALALRVQGGGAALPWWSTPVLLALAAAFGGLALGSSLRERLSGPAFQRGLFGVFVALGLANLMRG